MGGLSQSWQSQYNQPRYVLNSAAECLMLMAATGTSSNPDGPPLLS
jgi:hypothetical protein